MAQPRGIPTPPVHGPSNPFGRPPRAVLYARCSTKGGDQDPAVQLGQLRPWAAQRGWVVVAEEEDLVSGDPVRRHGDPPGLRAAMRALEERRADVLVVFSADRLVRSPTELLRLVGRVQALGAHVASYRDGADLDTTSEYGELIVFIRGWMSRMEMRLIRSRIKAGLDHARANGTRSDKAIGRPRAQGPSARRVAKLREQGATWQEIAEACQCSIAMARRRLADGTR